MRAAADFISGAARSGRIFSKVSRPQNVLYPGLLSAVLAYRSGGSWRVALTCYLLILALYALASVVNNRYDSTTDRLNGRHDILAATDAILPGRQRVFGLLCVIVVVVLQWPLSQPGSVLVTIAYLALLWAYSHPRSNIMSRGILGTLLLAACYGSLAALLGLAQDSTPATTAMQVAVFQIPLLLPILLAKDYKDLHGDSATGKRTPLVRYGARGVKMMAAVIGLSALIWYCHALRFDLNAMRVILLVGYSLLIALLHWRAGKITRILKIILTAITICMTISVYNTMV